MGISSVLTGPDDLRLRCVRTCLVLWSIYFAVVFGFGWFKVIENARDQRAETEWQVQFKHLQKVGDAESNRLFNRLMALNGKPASQHQLEIELNGGQPFNSNPNDSAHPYVWKDPKYGFRIAFNFHDGKLSGSLGPSETSYPLSVCPQPNRFSRDSSAESIRKVLSLTCGYAWLAFIAAWFLIPQRRFLSVQLSLAAAFTAGMAWAVNPFCTLEVPWIFHNGDLYLAALMLFASIYLLSATLVEVKARGNLLPSARFRLRDLLAGIVVVSLVLFAGPIGYFTLLVVLCSGLVFAIIHFVHRRWNPFRIQAAAA
jgi:hypothetical protein